MSNQYKLMIYFAVATLHYYRGMLTPGEDGELAGEWAAKNQAVLDQVVKEAKDLFDYELSHAQIGSAVLAYRANPSTEFYDGKEHVV